MDITPILEQTQTNLTRETVENVVKGYINSWCTKDPAARKALFRTDAIMEDPVNAMRFDGLDNIEAFWASAEDTLLKLKPTLQKCIVCGQEALAIFSMEMKMPDGTGTILEVHEVFVLDDDAKIIHLRAFWDANSATPIS